MRSVVVTGGFGVLGHAVASAFAAQSDLVARIDFAPSGSKPITGTLDIGNIDLTDPEAAKNALEQVTAAHGGIDILVNIAGGFLWETFQEGSLSSWAKMQAMNLVTTATITQIALPSLRAADEGRIINIGAGAAIKAGAGMGAYAASKSAVHRLTEALAEELSNDRVTVNAILPSIIDTPTNRSDMPEADTSQWVQPEAIADVILFLASRHARAISGALIPVTRGTSQ